MQLPNPLTQPHLSKVLCHHAEAIWRGAQLLEERILLGGDGAGAVRQDCETCGGAAVGRK